MYRRVSKTEAAARRSSTMESRDHSNAANPKSLMSRGKVCFGLLAAVLIGLSLNALVSCGGKKEKTVHLDLLICEAPKDNILNEQQVKMLVPFEMNNIRYLVQGNILNGNKAINYAKGKTWWKKLIYGQKPLFQEQVLIGNYLKGLDLSSLSLEQPLSVDDIERMSKSYEFVLGFSNEQVSDSSAYSFKIFTSSEDVLSNLTNEILVKYPDAKILLVYHPPYASSILPDSSSTIGKANVIDKPVAPPKVSDENKQVNTNKGTTTVQINNLLNKIANSDDKATDDLRKVLGNSLPVEGAANISNVQQLITDVSNGTRYRVTRVNTNDEGKLVSITVSKQ